ncbi:acyl-CoA dehydrogenase family protein, partial [Delftia tsuruhatensis]
AFALTEPRGGSHPADMRTRAVRDGDDYLITGVKHFISNAAEARFMVVFAKTDMEAGARGVSAFIVPRDLPGIQVSAPEKLMGIRGGHAFEVSLDGVRVPASHRLGAEGTGFKTAMKVLD